ncbi:MAG TPA: hypothetical protein VKB56_02410 [Terriglobales bacterium]|nr:hypothetical protein [Terriglobales bacterium]
MGDTDQSSPAVAETTEFEQRHAAEIAAVSNASFELVGAGQEELAELAVAAQEKGDRLTVLQRIAAMKVGDRIKVALLGTRDERFILIRDSNKIVAMAVLESPKVGESEMETFAAMKNIQEEVLRTLARNRRFMKHYAVVRALVNNPRTPVDVAMPLLNHLMVLDLQHLSRNKNISDTLRKLALRAMETKRDGRR